MQHTSLIKVCVFLVFVVVCRGQNTFNVQISLRVRDKIADLLQVVTTIIHSQLTMVKLGIVNVSQPVEALKLLSFGPKLTYYNNLQNFQVAFETNDFFNVQNGANIFNLGSANEIYGITYALSQPGNPTNLQIWSVKQNGNPDKVLGNGSFIVTKRPWYLQLKAAQQCIWTTPGLAFSSKKPNVIYACPIQNFTYKGYYTFAGAVAGALWLDQIDLYLNNAFHGQEMNVFIVEKSTGNFLGSSLGAMTYVVVNSNTLAYIKAVNSENPIIAGGTQKLIDNDWPEHLLIYNGYYLQSVLYTDPYPGLVWYIVVLLPAKTEANYLGSDTDIKLYYAVTIISSITLIIVLFGLIIIMILQNKRLFRLSKPIFTILSLFGGIILVIFCYFLTGSNTDITCAVRPWLFSLGLTAFIAPLTVKSFMLYDLFIANPYARDKIFRTDFVLLSTTAFLIISVVLVITTEWQYSNGGAKVISTTVMASNGAYTQVTYCSYINNLLYLGTTLGYNGLILFIGCFYSVLIRNLHGVVSGAYVHMIIVYNVGIALIIIIAIGRIDIPIIIAITIEIICLCYAVSLASLLSVGPNLYALYTLGDVAAADEVIEQIFHGKKNIVNPIEENNETT